MDHQIFKTFYQSKHLQKQKENGITRKLIGFSMLERGIPRKEYDILNDDGIIIGKVTSGGNHQCSIKE